jgi:hypothetical protein
MTAYPAADGHALMPLLGRITRSYYRNSNKGACPHHGLNKNRIVCCLATKLTNSKQNPLDCRCCSPKPEKEIKHFISFARVTA